MGDHEKSITKRPAIFQNRENDERTPPSMTLFGDAVRLHYGIAPTQLGVPGDMRFVKHVNKSICAILSWDNCPGPPLHLGVQPGLSKDGPCKPWPCPGATGFDLGRLTAKLDVYFYSRRGSRIELFRCVYVYVHHRIVWPATCVVGHWIKPIG